MVRINLLYKSFTYIKDPFAEEILIAEETSLSEILSDIGGLMGLFMGCSFVSLIEVFYHGLVVIIIKAYSTGSSICFCPFF